jgi:hypothetical protein
MTPNLPKGLTQRLEQGMEAAFTADSLAQLSQAIDVDALATGDPEAMDFERMGELVGQMTGRLVIKQTVGRYTPGQFAEQTVGYAIGGAVGREGGKLLVQVVEDQRGDPVEVEIEVIDEAEIDDADDLRDLSDDDDQNEFDGFDEFSDDNDGGEFGNE